MNPSLLHTLADSRVQEIQRDSRERHLAALARTPHPWRPVSHQVRGTGMRIKVGYTLVEAGLRLVATSGPHD
jgi:hypothetical protein